MTLREELAALEHDPWAHWTSHLLSILEPMVMTEQEQGQELSRDRDYVPTPMYTQAWESLERWKRQIDTPYAELTEAEKDSDREWADKTIDLLVKHS